MTLSNHLSLKCSNLFHSLSRWWFQTYFIFIPTWGRFPFWLIFFKWVETTNWLWQLATNLHPSQVKEDSWSSAPWRSHRAEAWRHSTRERGGQGGRVEVWWIVVLFCIFCASKLWLFLSLSSYAHAYIYYIYIYLMFMANCDWLCYIIYLYNILDYI